MSGPAYQRVLDALREHGHSVTENTARTKGRSACPAHGGDNITALSVTDTETRVLLKCHTRDCDGKDILEAVGLTVRDRYHDPKGAVYRYTDAGGLPTRTVTRTPDKQFRQFGDTRATPTLYRLPQVAAAVAAGQTVYLVEGEEDVHALEAVGVVATTAPMGAANFGLVDVAPFSGATVVAVVDNDEPGQRWAASVRDQLAGVAASLTFVHAAAGKDASDHIAAGHGVADLIPADDDPDERARRVFPRIDWHALWADEAEDEWLHVPLLPARRSIVIYSPPKVGKSLLALEFAVALSRGERFLGHQIERRIRVLYIDFENDPRGDVRSRLQAMGYGPDDLDHLDYLSFPTMAGLDSERGSLELLEAVRAYRCEVVIIDTISRAVAGEENSNDTWLGLYRHTGLKLKQAGVAMVRLDHTGKDEMKGTRGGSAKSGDVDAIWRLTRITDERFRLECTDSRMPVETKSLQVTRHRLPRLHHTVEALGALTDHQAKVAHLIDLCNANGLPADANREAVRLLASTRGIKARASVLAEVVRARKTVPDAGNSTPTPGLFRSAGTAGNSPHTEAALTSTNDCSRDDGNSREQSPTLHLFPGLLPMGGPAGTAEQNPLDEAVSCAACEQPLSQDRADYGKALCLDCATRSEAS